MVFNAAAMPGQPVEVGRLDPVLRPEMVDKRTLREDAAEAPCSIAIRDFRVSCC